MNFRLALDRLPKYDLIISFLHRKIVSWCCRVELRVCVAVGRRLYVVTRGDILATPEAVESSRRAVTAFHPDITSQLRPCLISPYQCVRRIKFELRDWKRVISCENNFSAVHLSPTCNLPVSRRNQRESIYSL